MDIKTGFAEYFWSKVSKTDDCWLWEAGKNGRGYGYIQIKGKQYRAHRISWELTYGSIPEGLQVCHHCDNPSCVRPDHLFLGTGSDNMQDALYKGRLPATVLTSVQVDEIRKIYSQNTAQLRSTSGRFIPRFTSIEKLANQYHVARWTISHIINKETWKYG